MNLLVTIHEATRRWARAFKTDSLVLDAAAGHPLAQMLAYADEQEKLDAIRARIKCIPFTVQFPQRLGPQVKASAQVIG